MSGVKKFKKLTSFASNLKNSAFIIFRHQSSSSEMQFQFAREITVTICFPWNINKEAPNYTVLLGSSCFDSDEYINCLTVSEELGCLGMAVFSEPLSNIEVISFTLGILQDINIFLIIFSPIN